MEQSSKPEAPELVLTPPPDAFALASESVRGSAEQPARPKRDRSRDRKRSRTTGRPRGRPRKDGAAPASQPAAGAGTADVEEIEAPSVEELTQLARAALDALSSKTGTTPPAAGDAEKLAAALVPVLDHYGAQLAKMGPFTALGLFGVTYLLPRGYEAYQAKRAARREVRAPAAVVPESRSLTMETPVRAARNGAAKVEDITRRFGPVVADQ